MICIALDDANVHEFDQQEEWSGEEQEQHLVPMCQHQQQNEAMDNMFDELNEHYLAEQALRMNNNEDNNNNANIQQEAYAAVADRIINSTDAEITHYREEPSLPLQDAEGKFFLPFNVVACQSSKIQDPISAGTLLIVYSCNFSSSQTFFSVAGLTIAKDRARLAPQTANELIFLHDAISALQKFE